MYPMYAETLLLYRYVLAVKVYWIMQIGYCKPDFCLATGPCRTGCKDARFGSPQLAAYGAFSVIIAVNYLDIAGRMCMAWKYM